MKSNYLHYLQEAFLEMMRVERAVSANTIAAYKQDLADLFHYLLDLFIDPLGNSTSAENLCEDPKVIAVLESSCTSKYTPPPVGVLRAESSITSLPEASFPTGLSRGLLGHSSWIDPLGNLGNSASALSDRAWVINWLSEIKVETLEKYISHLHENNARTTTIARRLSAAKQFWYFLCSEGHIKDNPTLYVERPRLTRALPKILVHSEVEKLLSYVRNDLAPTPYNLRLRAIIEILCASGLRVSECASLSLGSLRQLNEQPILLVKSKGGAEDFAILHEEAISALRQYLTLRSVFINNLFDFRTKAAKNPENPLHEQVESSSEGGSQLSLKGAAKVKNARPNMWLFPAPTITGHITRHSIALQLKNCAAECGVRSNSRAGISPHYLRHSYATYMLERGVDLLSVKKLLRHKDISTTQIYLHVMPDKIQRLVSEYHPLSTK